MLCEHVVKLIFAVKQFLKDANPRPRDMATEKDHDYALEDLD